MRIGPDEGRHRRGERLEMLHIVLRVPVMRENGCGNRQKGRQPEIKTANRFVFMTQPPSRINCTTRFKKVDPELPLWTSSSSAQCTPPLLCYTRNLSLEQATVGARFII